jgi:hypothetical protein
MADLTGRKWPTCSRLDDVCRPRFPCLNGQKADDRGTQKSRSLYSRTGTEICLTTIEKSAPPVEEKITSRQTFARLRNAD